jgi:hypothetical protein
MTAKSVGDHARHPLRQASGPRRDRLPPGLRDAFLHLKNMRGARRFLRHPLPEERHHRALPRRIYLFWDAGFAQAPEVCRMCLESWRAWHPDWEIVALDATEAEAVLPRASLPADLLSAHYADILRLTLLAERGGVWADATALCLRPLDDWLLNVFNQSDFFAFRGPARDRVLANWFLASVPGSPLAAGGLDEVRRYWAGRSRAQPEYFWFHYLFELRLRRSRNLARAWRFVPHLSSRPLHLLQEHHARGTLDPAVLEAIAATPMQKLNWRAEYDPALLDDLVGKRRTGLGEALRPTGAAGQGDDIPAA